jgi:uncharacterized protein YndB with AHSA1/START domain
MSVTNVEKDFDSLTMSMTAVFAAPVERVWQVWADPRQLERWWGPPTYPATFVAHDLTPGGRMHYFMTSPEGEQYHGCWEVLAVDAPHSLEVQDAFADDSGKPLADMPLMRMRIVLRAQGDGTRMESVSTYESREAMEKVIEMGVEEGMTGAVNQIDALVAEPA